MWKCTQSAADEREADSPLPTWRDFVEAFPKPSRIMAPFRYYGGKGHLARRLVPLLPRGQVYVEPFCGAASVFWHLPRPYPVEVLNDLDEDIVGVFRALQDKHEFEQLAHRLTFTPYSRAEFVRALRTLRDPDATPLDRAWAAVVAFNQSLAGLAERPGEWGRVFGSARGMASTSSFWRSRLRVLQVWHDRLTRVQLDCRDALEVIRYWDSPDTVFYIDPPYSPSTRVPGERQVYRHEFTDAQHSALIDTLLQLKGKAVVSGYRTSLYDRLDWPRIEVRTACSGSNHNRGTKMCGKGAGIRHVPRTEVLWISPSCVAMLPWGASQ
mgnify:CR=1 FL=1